MGAFYNERKGGFVCYTKWYIPSVFHRRWGNIYYVKQHVRNIDAEDCLGFRREFDLGYVNPVSLSFLTQTI